MSTLEQQQNPANALKTAVKTAAERKRVPMSVPVQKLQVPDIPGYHLHWFTGNEGRIQQAIQAGYEFVDRKEVGLNYVGIGSNSATSGNTDMGSHVSIASGSAVDGTNQPVRLILMKIKQEWWDEDQKVLEARNDQVALSLRGGDTGQDMAPDRGERHRYVDPRRTAIPDLFTKKLPKSG